MFLLPGCALIVDLNKSYDGPDDAGLTDATAPMTDSAVATPPDDALVTDALVPPDAPDTAPPPVPPPSPFAIPCDPGDAGDGAETGVWHLDCTFGTTATFVLLGDAGTPPAVDIDPSAPSVYGAMSTRDPTTPTMTLVRANSDGGFTSLFAGVGGVATDVAAAPLFIGTEIGVLGNVSDADGGTVPVGAFIVSKDSSSAGGGSRDLSVDGGRATIQRFIGEVSDTKHVNVSLDLYISSNVETANGVVPGYVLAPIGIQDNAANLPTLHAFPSTAANRPDGAPGEWLASSETGTLLDGGGMWVAGPSTVPGRGVGILLDPSTDTVLDVKPVPFPLRDIFSLAYEDFALALGEADASVGLAVMTEAALTDGGIEYFPMPFTPTSERMIATAAGDLMIAAGDSTAASAGNVVVRRLVIGSAGATKADPSFGDAGVLTIPIGYPTDVGGIRFLGEDLYIGLLVHTPTATPAILLRLRH